MTSSAYAAVTVAQQGGRWPRRLFWWGLLHLSLLVVAGCGVSPADPWGVASDRGRDPARRVAALERAASGGELDLGRLGALLWSDREPDLLRVRALDLAVAHHPEALRVALRRRLPEIDRWDVLRRAIGVAVERDWADLAPAIIQSFGRPSGEVADEERPEYEALEALFPGRTVEGTLWAVWLEPASGLPARAAAWGVLARLVPADRLREGLNKAPEVDTHVADLRAAAAVVDRLPATAEELLWLATLRARDNGDWWRGLQSRVAALSAGQHEGLGLRHLPLVAATGAERLGMGRLELQDHLWQRLSGAEHVMRSDYGAAGGPASESFSYWADRLCWGDLLALSWTLDAMATPRVARAWFDQAEADRADTASEHGGVLRLVDGRLEAAGFLPLLTQHDRKFYAPPDMIQAMYEGLAHYHFHAQATDNRAFAGPGRGDLAFVDRMRPNALVLTPMGRGRMNVDFYAPGGIVVDLGVIQRP